MQERPIRVSISEPALKDNSNLMSLAEEQDDTLSSRTEETHAFTVGGNSLAGKIEITEWFWDWNYFF